MACSVKPTSRRVPSRAIQSEAAAASRIRVCEKCEWNKKGVCEVIAAKNNGVERAIIKDGVKRLSVGCPINKWKAVTTVCVKCNRSEVTDDNTHVCKWCEVKSKTGRRFRTAYKPRVVPTSLAPMPFDGVPIRDLHFFLYPRFEASTEYHIHRLNQLKAVFNGKKVCCVAIDQETKQDKYHAQLCELFDEVYYIQNDPNRREAAGFVTTLDKLKSKHNDRMICFAHGKGQQSHTHSSAIIKTWNDAMYETVVANYKDAARALAEGYALAGSFKSVGNFASTPYRWHYSGSFFWARSVTLFKNKSWKQMCAQWFAAESYVGRHFAAEEGFCLFGDHITGGSMYKHETWARLQPELEEWRKTHERIGRSFATRHLAINDEGLRQA